MASRKSASQRIVGFAVLAGVAALISLSVARVASHFLEFDEDMLHGAVAGLPSLWQAVAASPLDIDWGSGMVRAAAAMGAALPLLVALLSMSKGMRLENEDTGREHGDDRFATSREILALVDPGMRANNIFYTASAGLPIVARNGRTKKILYGRNLNMICYGISGLGKTFNVSLVSILQSVGEALPERAYGLRNVPAHLKRTTVWRMAAIALRPLASRAASARGAMASAMAGARHRVRALVKGPNPPAQGEPVAKDPRGGALDALRRETSSRGGRKSRRAAARSLIGEGFDIVDTDPKGNNVCDCGRMLEAAGVDVKVFNTVDFREGLHYNPFAYIPERYIDLKPASAIEVAVSGTFECEGEAFDMMVGRTRGLKLAAGAGAVSSSANHINFTASLGLETTSDSLDDVPSTSKTSEQLAEELRATDPGDPGFETLRRQLDLKWLERETGGFCVPRPPADGGGYREGEPRVDRRAGNGCAKLAQAVKSISYRHSEGAIEAEFVNFGPCPVDADIRFGLDPALEAVSYSTVVTCEPGFESTVEAIDGGLVWRIRNASGATPKLPGSKLAVKIECRVKGFRVPDGVALTKTIDTLAANLRRTDAASAGSNDPFWEDSKRLCLMSLAAFLFEAYDERERTIPSLMKLLDAALPDPGSPAEKSPLEVLMETWEHGRVYQSAEPRRAGSRGGLRGGRWVPAETPPHGRSESVALHCFRAFTSGAEETVRSVIITCQAALVNLVADDVRELLSYDELALDTLGDPGQKQALFIVTSDTDSPFDFLTALVIQQSIDLLMEKAYKRYGGRLPRHVRFELDEAANLGKIPILVRAMAVVRSRNVSIALYLQAKAQLALVYGEKEADVIADNCSTMLFLGAQTKDTLEEVSERVGKETVYSRTFQRNFGEAGITRGSGESIQSTERAVRSTTQLSRLSTGKLLCFIHGCYPILDDKYQTYKHPLYAYVNPESERTWLMPPCAFDGRFDFREYARRHRARAIRKPISHASKGALTER